MLWNCNGKIKEIEFKYYKYEQEYCCYINRKYYTWDKSFRNVKPWDWFREGYTIELAEWCDWMQ